MARVLSTFDTVRSKVASGMPSSSVVLSFNHDGLEIARVRSNRRWLPVWHIVFFVYVALLIRLITIAQIGPAAYTARMDELRSGNALERAAAVVMQMDPVSQALAYKIRGGLSFVNNRVLDRET